ncbi:MAG: hypothetical protein FWG03_05870 [Clostridiales bacterium]|nr:hypothetical protein [Clostridiales bacterium]
MIKTKILFAIFAALLLMVAAACTNPATTDNNASGTTGPDTPAGAEDGTTEAPEPTEPGGPSEPSDSTDPAGQPAEGAAELPGQDPSSADAFVSVDFATDELMDGFEMHIVDRSATEGTIRVIIMPAVTLKDFKFTEIGVREDDPGNMLYEKTVIYSTDELTPEWPFVVGIDFFGTFPTRGISFVDGNNVTRHFAIAESGNDGSLFLIEFQ